MRSSPPKLHPNPPTPRESDSAAAADAKRRGFLLALGGGIGAAALAAGSRPGVAPAASGSAEPAAGESYRLTDHVKRYYRTAKT